MAFEVIGAMCAPAVDGKRIEVYFGSFLPDGVSAAEIAHLVSVGLVREVADEPADEGDEVVEVVAPVVPVAESKRPLNTAPTAVWVEYAVSLGHDVETVKALKKSEIQHLCS